MQDILMQGKLNGHLIIRHIFVSLSNILRFMMNSTLETTQKHVDVDLLVAVSGVALFFGSLSN